MIFLDALAGKNFNRPPVWLMRQAGRYLPEYRNIRKQHAFLDMIYTPELAAEVTLQPIRRYNFDAAILFSDILVTGSALGSPLDFIDKIGPVFSEPIRSLDAVKALATDSGTRLDPICQTIQCIKAQSDKPVIGFAGGPFTVASYMIEGKSSASLSTVKRMMYDAPEILTALLERLTPVTIAYLQDQIQAGVHAVQLFDTWTNHLTIDQFKTYCLPYLKRIIAAIHDTPVILFCKNTGILWPYLVSALPDCISADWGCDIQALRKVLPDTMALQGNIDPFLLYAAPAVIQERVHALVQTLASPNYIVNLGHGIMPDTPLESVAALVNAVHSCTTTRADV